jgi:hypothetical protein
MKSKLTLKLCLDDKELKLSNSIYINSIQTYPESNSIEFALMANLENATKKELKELSRMINKAFK